MAEEIKVCDKLETCAFFQAYESDQNKKLALKGFVQKYCKGDQPELCIRKKVAVALGHENVPVNMMPNGLALSGTLDQEWTEDVKKVVAQEKG